MGRDGDGVATRERSGQHEPHHTARGVHQDPSPRLQLSTSRRDPPSDGATRSTTAVHSDRATFPSPTPHRGHRPAPPSPFDPCATQLVDKTLPHRRVPRGNRRQESQAVASPRTLRLLSAVVPPSPPLALKTPPLHRLPPGTRLPPPNARPRPRPPSPQSVGQRAPATPLRPGNRASSHTRRPPKPATALPPIRRSARPSNPAPSREPRIVAHAPAPARTAPTRLAPTRAPHCARRRRSR
ncbi:hypothetical protein K438DRAFT_528484 [Mycena galopus ATCC 62051]|nr:hypothetical protein K438DRAFT_528484 [Mycena galopus ATCC 62051]